MGSKSELGLFIHWGIYSIYGSLGIGAEWVMLQNKISKGDYLDVGKKYNFGKKFNAKSIITVALQMNASYIVFTSKHHDGFCMYNTKYTDFNIYNISGTDPLRELAIECKKSGLKMGIYYSVIDWSHPDFPKSCNPFSFHSDHQQRDPCIKRYRTYMVSQIRELLTNYGEISALWFDGRPNKKSGEPFYQKMDVDGIRNMVREIAPNCHINDRLGTECDFYSVENYTKKHIELIDSLGQSGKSFELCIRYNNHWGYYKGDNHYKSNKELVRIWNHINGKGGNLLLNIAPDENGYIDAGIAKRIKLV
jgi:alpha-L-fucosidase